MSIYTSLSVKWQSLTQGTTNRRIFRGVVTVGFVTLAIRFATFLKEILVANSFGISSDLDAFLLAFTIVGIPVGIVLNAFQSSFIPVFIKVSSSGDTARIQRFLTATALLSLLAMTLLASLLVHFLPYVLKVLAYGFTADQHKLIATYIWGLLPFLFLSGLSVLGHGVLQAGKQFMLSTSLPIYTPLATIIILLAFGKQIGVTALVWATLMGAVLEYATLHATLARKGISLFSFKASFELTQDVKDIFLQTFAMMGGAFLMYGTTVVDQAMASTLDAGSISALSFGSKIPAVITALGANPLAAAVFPYFSEMAAARDWSGCRWTLRKYTQIILAVSIPVVLGLWLFSRPIVRLIYEHGSFDSRATELVTGIQQAYLLQVPSVIMTTLAIRLISAAGKNHLLTIISLASFLLNIGFNYIFMQLWGVKGIAASTSLVCFISAVLCFTCAILITRPEKYCQR